MSTARTNPDQPVPGDGPTGLSLPDRVLRKSDWPVVATELTERMLEATDAPTAYVLLAQVEEVIAVAKKALKPKVSLAAAGAPLNIGGATVQYRKVPGKWDYRGNPKIAALEAKIATLTELLKAAQAEAQNLSEPVYVEDGGYEILPAVQGDPSYTVAVTFPKE